MALQPMVPQSRPSANLIPSSFCLSSACPSRTSPRELRSSLIRGPSPVLLQTVLLSVSPTSLPLPRLGPLQLRLFLGQCSALPPADSYFAFSSLFVISSRKRCLTPTIRSEIPVMCSRSTGCIFLPALPFRGIRTVSLIHSFPVHVQCILCSPGHKRHKGRAHSISFNVINPAQHSLPSRHSVNICG